jgi:hypothetical protein
MIKTANIYKRAVRGRIRTSYLASPALVLHVCHNLLDGVLALLWMVCPAVIEVDNLLPLLQNSLRSQWNVNRETRPSSSLPPCLPNPTATDLVEATSWVLGSLLGAQSKNQRRYVVWLECLDHLFRHDGRRHGGTSIRGNGIDVNVVLVAFKGQRSREPKNTAFLFVVSTRAFALHSHVRGCSYGCGVVRLAKVTVDTTGGSGVHNTTKFLLEKNGPCRLGDFVSAAKMDI